MSPALALRRHRLPRFWLGLTLGLVASGVGAAYWWEQQLPQRLEKAALGKCAEGVEDLGEAGLLEGLRSADHRDFEVQLFVRGAFELLLGLGEFLDQFEEFWE